MLESEAHESYKDYVEKVDRTKFNTKGFIVKRIVHTKHTQYMGV